LALSEPGAFAQLPGSLERTLVHHAAHGFATVHHYKTVRLLDEQL
jgi:hypothetical protein